MLVFLVDLKTPKGHFEINWNDKKNILDLPKITATTWSINKIIPVSIALIGNSIKKVTFENTATKFMKSKQNQTTGDLVQELKEDLSHLGEDVSHLASKMDDFKKSSFKIQHALGPVHVLLSPFHYLIQIKLNTVFP